MRFFRIFPPKFGLVMVTAALMLGTAACAGVHKAGDPAGQSMPEDGSLAVRMPGAKARDQRPEGPPPIDRILPQSGSAGPLSPNGQHPTGEADVGHPAPSGQVSPIARSPDEGEDAPLPQQPVFRVPEAAASVRGIYVSGRAAGSKTMLDRLLNLLDRTDMNAVVLDVKNDYGRLTYDSGVPLADETGADADPPVKDISALLDRLKNKNLYVIGRIVAFKDPHLAKVRSDLAIRTKNGQGAWRDRKGAAWVDPYLEEVRQYNLALAKEAAALGFDEIQFDYVRFPDNGRKVDAEVRYRNPDGTGKAELIGRFLADARRELHAAGVPVSADVFGLTTTAKDDMGIGQQWELVAANVDFISPMVYPSHYAEGSYGVKHPDLNPRTIVAKAIRDALGRNRAMSRPAAIRPWLQCFTARWVKPHQPYGKAEIDAQIGAVRSLGVEGYLLWDPTCRYKPLTAE